MMFWYSALIRFLRFFSRLAGRHFPEKLAQTAALKNQDLFCFKTAIIKSENTLWCHCASGEFEYAKPVLRLLKTQFPKSQVVVTFTSPSVRKSLNGAPDIDVYGPLPWDLEEPLIKFIDFFKPKALIVARTDLWPNMLQVARKKNIPRLLFSATCSDDIFKKNSVARFFKTQLFKELTEIHCVSSDDQKNLKALHLQTPIKIFGDTRYDQAVARLQNAKTLKPYLKDRSRQILIAGSTWPQDEEVLSLLIADAFRESWPVDFILVPHEPTSSHIRRLQALLHAQGLKSHLYSSNEPWPPGDVLIVDQVGILADLYAYGNFAFVGGSFRKSVHSVMEPLAAGLLTAVGPYHKNNREACEFQNFKISQKSPITMVQTVPNSDEFKRWLKLALEAPEAQSAIKNKVLGLCGSSQSTVDWITPKIFNLAGKNPGI